jgi:hypothetical protein
MTRLRGASAISKSENLSAGADRARECFGRGIGNSFERRDTSIDCIAVCAEMLAE